MRFSILLSAVAAIILPISAQICLTEFQPIANFPQACTDAYSQTINGCSAAQDFSSPNTCTPGCIAALDAVQTDIQTACSGEQVTKASVIGQFFLGNGPEFVCSGLKISESGTGQQSVITITTSQAATTTHDKSTIPTVPAASAPAVATTTEMRTRTGTNGSPVIVQTTLTKSTLLPTMQTMTPATTASSTKSTKSEHTQSTTPAMNRSSSSSTSGSQSNQTTNSSTSTISGSSTATSQSKQTTSPGEIGGGGSPFDPNGNRGVKLMGDSWLFGLMVWFWVAGSIR